MAKMRCYVEQSKVARKRKLLDRVYRPNLNMSHENLRPPHQSREKPYRWQRDVFEGL